METGFLFFAESVLLGIGLAMDAFSVSLANGLNEPDMERRRMNLVAGTYAVFQFIMPLAGWVLVHTAVVYFRAFEKFIPWIALALLAGIGIQMIAEGVSYGKNGEEGVQPHLTAGRLLLQGLATSIDALSVGFATEKYSFLSALVSSFIIASVTFLICSAGVRIGKKAGTRLSGKASVLGGVILILIGAEILITSLL